MGEKSGEQRREPAPLPVSVLIPAFNAAPYLLEALESVGAQTRRPKEVIVVNDGSTDATSEIARAWGATVIDQPNTGLAGARNAGLRAASQPWVALLDADDRWRPDKLEQQWRVHERFPRIALIATDHSVLVDGAIVEGSTYHTLPQYRRLRRRPAGEFAAWVGRSDLVEALVRGNFIPPSSLLLSAEFVRRHGLWFEEALLSVPDFHVSEDYEWYLRALRWTDAVIIERPLVEFRRTPTGLSANGARLRYGDLKLGELVRERPLRYANGADEGLRDMRSLQFRQAGLRYLSLCDPRAARSMFDSSLREAYSPLTSALALGVRFFEGEGGPRRLASALQVWRRLVKPIVAPLLKVR